MTSDPLFASGPDKTRTACRGLNLGDVIVLIAGMAVFLSVGVHLLLLCANTLSELVRAASGTRASPLWDWPIFWSVIRDPFRNTVWYGLQILEAFLMGMTPAYFIIRLRRPHPTARALIRQPGTMAALAMVFGLFWGTGFLLWVFPGRVDSFTAAPIAVGAAVAISWIILALSRRWEAEPGWLDGAGRFLGATAIGVALLFTIVFRI